MSTETEIQAKILHILQYVGLFCWRQGSGRIQRGTCFINTGKPGLGDIGGVMPGGRHFEVECKTTDGRLSVRQKAHGKRIGRLGGVYLVMRSAGEAVRFALDTMREYYERDIERCNLDVLDGVPGQRRDGGDHFRVNSDLHHHHPAGGDSSAVH